MKSLRAAAALTAALMAGCNSTNAVPGPSPAQQHPIKHVIIMMQENRSFNNIFAGFPGATTALTGACLPAHGLNQKGQKVKWCQSGSAKLTPVSLESSGVIGQGIDIDHSHNGFKIECNLNGSGVCQNNGFDKIRYGEAGIGGNAMLYPYAYIERSESKAYWDFAKQYSLADQMFFSQTASSFISHQIILSGTVQINSTESLTDQPDQQPWGCDAPPGTKTPILKTDGKEYANGPFPCFTQYESIAELLDAAKVSWKYYVAAVEGSDFSGGVWNGFDAIKKVRYSPDWKNNISSPNTTFFTDVKNGTLPAVSWVIPTLADSDHPASGCNGGPRWVTSVINAVGQSKYWNDTAVLLLWDDWGGWYDPVPPPQINYTSLGFRVGLVAVSPWARPDNVSHTQYAFGSILHFIENNFNLGSLNTTDATSTPITDMFDFTQKPLAYKPEPLPKSMKCTGGPSAKVIIEHDGGVPE